MDETNEQIQAEQEQARIERRLQATLTDGNENTEKTPVIDYYVED